MNDISHVWVLALGSVWKTEGNFGSSALCGRVVCDILCYVPSEFPGLVWPKCPECANHPAMRDMTIEYELSEERPSLYCETNEKLGFIKYDDNGNRLFTRESERLSEKEMILRAWELEIYPWVAIEDKSDYIASSIRKKRKKIYVEGS